MGNIFFLQKNEGKNKFVKKKIGKKNVGQNFFWKKKSQICLNFFCGTPDMTLINT